MDELLINLIGTVVTVVASIAMLAYWLGRKFTEIDYRFREIDHRFEEVDERFSEFEKRIDARFERIETRFERLEGRINRLIEGFTGYQEFFIELLASEGILKAEKATLAKGELLRITKLISVNPFTKEEVKRLEELIMKDELTLEEALELRELARKAIREYGEYPEVWKLHAYASIMVGLALRKQLEREKKEQRQC